MASSVSGVKMNQILRCDWQPERTRWSCLARPGLPAVFREKKFPESHVNPLFGRDGWILASSSFFASLWTSIPYRSINTQKRPWPISSHLDVTLGQ